MTDEQRNKLENRLTFMAGGFTCLYIHDTNTRIGIDGPMRMCNGSGCKDGGPCRRDCSYYAEITLLALNNFRKDGEEQ